MRLVAWASGAMPDEERAARQLSEEDRLKLCEWYRLHGIDPNTVPADHELVYDKERMVWVVERYAAQGHALSLDGDLPRYKTEFVELAPFPEIGPGGVFE